MGRSPHATVRGGGEGVSIPVAGQPQPDRWRPADMLMFPAARQQTPLCRPCLYRIHTFVCNLDMQDYRLYKALST